MDRYRRTSRSFSSRGFGSPLSLLSTVAVLLATTVLGTEVDTPTNAKPSKQAEAHTPQTDAAIQGGPDLIRSKGAFAKLWNEQAFVGPGVLALPEASLEAGKVCLPSDFDPHQAVVIAGGWLAREAPDVLAEIVRNTKRPKEFVLLASSPRERDLTIRLLGKRGLSLNSSDFLVVPTDTGWVRDYGPVFIQGSAGKLLAYDAAYDRPGRARDDAATRSIADGFQVAATDTQLRWQGGNLLSNGEGLLVTTTQSINANIEFGNDVDTVTHFLQHHFGLRQVVVLEHLQGGERTGHVDMFGCFTSPDTIVVGAYDEAVDPRNAAVLDRNAARLAEVRTSRGKLNVVRVPMPTNEDGVWRSPTNVVFNNGILLVPVYPDVDPTRGEEALILYRRFLPDWEVVGIDASTMARHQGGLRCVTLYVPEAVSQTGP